MADLDGSTLDGEEGHDVELSSRVAGIVRGRDVSLRRAASVAAVAGGDLVLQQSACGALVANGGASIRYGGCGPLLANGDVSIEYGGCQTILAAGGATLGRSSFVGFVASPKVIVEDGGRVLFGTKQALAFGAVAGVVVAAFRGFRRR